MKSFFLALFLAALAPAGRADSAVCWVVCSTKTGDMGIGATVGGANRLGCTITGRTARIVYRINPATGRRALFRTFVGGTISTKMTWAQFVAAEGVR
jgi:hypothetical protein